MVNIDRQQVDVVGCLIDVSDVSTAAEKIVSLAKHQRQGYVCLANVHMCMTAKDDLAFAAVLRQASLVVADGRPVYWAQRLLGAQSARQVRGVDLMLELCKLAETTGLKLGFYGGQDETLLTQLQQQLLSMFPRLQIVYAWAPPFRPLSEQEDALQRRRMINSGADVLLVGLGCPKQECWMAEHQQLPLVMLGVGAAFDFIAGRKKQAHRLFQRLGLEWLHRLFSEPVRLSGRYFRHNPRFILGFTKQWLRSLIMKSTS
ncbi:MAG: WecB/TagA/CpsF family glycosyltransferase [Rheinheimera sp.]|nr:MAG: WecB/TagA/CpsF family glycosyltransferase [Rheinheimera sp.]